MRANGSLNAKGCNRVCVGEVDTTAPFQSVKDAVALFGEGRGRFRKPKPCSVTEKVLFNETKLHLKKNELYKLKVKVKNAETAKAEALLELEKAKKTAMDLTDKLKAVNECGDSAIISTEVVMNQEKHYEQVESLLSAAQNQDLVKAVTADLDGAKESLQRVAEEESALRRLVESLKLELEYLRNKHTELDEEEARTESIVRELDSQIQKAKIDLETFCAEESKVSNGLEGTESKTLQPLSSKKENASKAGELEKEGGDVKIALQEIKEELRAALLEAEEAKAAEESAVERNNSLSERTDTTHALVSESDGRITITSEEYEYLSWKVEEYDKLAEIKLTATLAEVETMKAIKNEALKNLEMNHKEIQDIKSATMEALAKAETAEEAIKAMEGEIRRWREREREQKKVAEAVSRILTETKKSVRSSTHKSEKLKQNYAERFNGAHKLGKVKTCVSKKVPLPSVSRIFHRRKNHDNGKSAACLPY